MAEIIVEKFLRVVVAVEHSAGRCRIKPKGYSKKIGIAQYANKALSTAYIGNVGGRNHGLGSTVYIKFL